MYFTEQRVHFLSKIAFFRTDTYSRGNRNRHQKKQTFSGTSSTEPMGEAYEVPRTRKRRCKDRKKKSPQKEVMKVQKEKENPHNRQKRNRLCGWNVYQKHKNIDWSRK